MQSPYKRQPHEIAQRVLRPIEMENLEAGGTGGRPISLGSSPTWRPDRGKTADFERPFVNPRIGFVHAQLAGKKNMPEIFRDRQVLKIIRRRPSKFETTASS